MPACERYVRPSSLTLVALVGVVLFGCAQVERVPDAGPAVPAPTPAPAPSATPSQAKPAPPPAGSASQLRGLVSFYGNDFAGKKTASGDTFDPAALTMAHRTLPFGTRVRVTNLENKQVVEVVVNDRGPFVAGRIADLSAGAARSIGITDGVVEALLEILQGTHKN